MIQELLETEESTEATIEVTEKRKRRKLWEERKGWKAEHIDISAIPIYSNIRAANDWTTPSKDFIVVQM